MNYLHRASALLLNAILASASLLAAAHADAVLLNQSNLIGAPTVAPPAQHPFTASAAEALTVTLTDFQTPAAFGSLQVAVTLDGALVGSAAVDATHVATVAIPAQAGNYVLYVIGTPDTTQGFGNFGVCVTRNADPTPRTCVPDDSFSDSLTTPTPPASTPASTLSTSFTSTTPGTYTIVLADAAFPAPLVSVSAIITQGSTPVGGVINAGTSQVTLAAGTTYTLLAQAQADLALHAGLYGFVITDPAGNTVFDRSTPVGALGSATVVNNPTTQSLTLTLTDFGYPSPLANLGAAVTSGGTTLGNLTAAGTLPNTTAPAGSLNVWIFTAAGGQPGVFALDLSSSSGSLLSVDRVVNPAGNTANSFAFIANLPAAGTYNLAVNDFAFPATLQSLSATIAQGGTVLQQDSTGNFSAASGAAVVLVNASAPQSGSGIFGVSVATTGASPTILLDQTQALGGVFDTQILNVGTSGAYNVTLTDLGFPTLFQNLAVVVSRGSQVQGKIFGGGPVPLNITPGQYVLTFIATPGAQNYGLYSVEIATTPPTVTFSSSVTSVTAGNTVQLTWSSQNATACTAAGASGWSGAEPASGTTAIVIAATSTLTLQCTGPGGSSAVQSVTVTATTVPAPSGSGGGGAIDLTMLLLLAVTLLASTHAANSSREGHRGAAKLRHKREVAAVRGENKPE